MRGDVWLRSDTIAGWGRYCLAALRRNSWSRAFFSEIAQGASAKTVWRSMRAEQVSIALRWRRPRSELIRRARSDTGQAAEKCSKVYSVTNLRSVQYPPARYRHTEHQ